MQIIKKITIIIILFLAQSCASVASNISKQLPKKLEDAKVYQIEDSVWQSIENEIDSISVPLSSNKLNLSISYDYLNREITNIVKSGPNNINFFHNEIDQIDSIESVPILKPSDKNILVLNDPIISQSNIENKFSFSIKYYMRKRLFDAGIFSLPIEKSGKLNFDFAPEIIQNRISLNSEFVSAEGGLIDEFSSFAFKGFINLFLKGMNNVEIPSEYLKSEKISLSDSPIKMGYHIYELDATIESFNSKEMNYKISSDFSIFFNDSGFVNVDSIYKPTLSLDISVIQNTIDQVMKERNHKLMIKGDTLTNDYFYLNSINLSSKEDKLILHTKYKGKVPVTVFNYGVDGELDIVVSPIILNNKLYLKFEEFIFYGEKGDTDLLSSLLNILISKSVQKALYVDLNYYLPDYNETIKVNDHVQIENIQAFFTKGMIKNDRVYIFSKLSAKLKFN